MLGLQETRPAGTSSTKSYSCVACSAKFHGLASLLVHQATHANEVSSPLGATSPICSHCGGLFASEELLEKHRCMLLPPPVPQDLHICECGEGFQEIGAIEEHKKIHEMKTSAESDNESTIKIEVMTDSSQFSAPVLPSENSPSHGTEEALHESPKTLSEFEKKDGMATSNVGPMQHPISQGHHDGLQPACVSSPMIPTEPHSESFKNKAKLEENENVNSSDSEDSTDRPAVTNKKTLLKMLASAYMSRRQPAQIKWGQNKRALPPRKVSPRAPVQAPVAVSLSNPECTVNQLRQKVAKYAPSREGFTPSERAFSNKGSVVSVTKALCPVVALETRQKLCRDNVEGRYQCGICRRVFQSKDNLIMHHALHRKERVKFCRRCQQFVINVISGPDSHICSGYAGTAKFFPTLMYPQKLFHCQLCNRSYTRRHRLKTHKCQWVAAPTQKDAKVCDIAGESNAREQLLSMKNSTGHVNVAVNTEGLNTIKTEESAESPGEDKFQMNPNSFKSETSPTSFPPFLPNKSKFGLVQSKENANEMMERDDSINPSASEAKGIVESNTEGSDSLERGQWTVPLDDAEIDVLTDEENCSNIEEASKENTDDEVIILEPSVNCGTSSTSKDFQVHVSDGGVRRFSCNRCHKSYSRRFTLNQHIMICRARKLMESNSYGSVAANIHGVKKKFPCPHCGSSFTRKDNMNMHRKRCQSMRDTSTVEGNGMLDKQSQATQENIFVLPPVSKSQVRQEGSSNVGSGSWGIMSLPSVLPRKVTCECGASFTCPRLLFEHLQMHALESYICSQCGENLQSWADFEVHQQLHLQTSRPKIEDKGSQQQQSHVQSQLRQESALQSSVQNPKKDSQDLFKWRLNRRPLTGPYVCHRCKKIFRLRKSLLRHLTRSCKGDSTAENKHSCSRCGMTFQNSLAQDVHMRGNTCTPAFKPLRCPVCTRWFSSLEGLKRHLLSHSQEESLTCQICGCKCSSPAALEEHKRGVHSINKDSESPTVQSAHVSQSSSSDAFRCQICQRSYPKLQSLKDHLRKVHRPKHLNPVSVGSFESKGLSKGVAQQNQTKQFQCHICSRTYQDIQSLKNHRRRVHRILGGGLQPSRGNLQQSHSNPFQCQICSRTYPDIRSLRNHRRRVHRILGGLGLEIYKGITHQNQSSLFKCQICQQSYPDLGALINHKRKEHCILRDVLESTKMDATHLEHSQSDVFHITDPSGNFEPIA